MKRKRMTQKVVAGLISLSSIVGAGGPDDIVGYRDEQLEMPEFQETRKVWENILAACAWIDDYCPRRARGE